MLNRLNNVFSVVVRVCEISRILHFTGITYSYYLLARDYFTESINSIHTVGILIQFLTDSPPHRVSLRIFS